MCLCAYLRGKETCIYMLYVCVCLRERKKKRRVYVCYMHACACATGLQVDICVCVLHKALNSELVRGMTSSVHLSDKMELAGGYV